MSIYCDFEFNNTLHERVNLVCCTTWDSRENEPREWWLHKDPLMQEELRRYIVDNGDQLFVSWSVVAEGRSFISLGLDPRLFRWRDLFLEYRMLTNHCYQWMYGKQLVDGKVKMTVPPKKKWERTEEDNAPGGSFKPKHSLAEATYKMLGVVRDTEHKDKMRDLIISAPEEFEEQDMLDIQDYCTEDVVELPNLDDKIVEALQDLIGIDMVDDFDKLEELYREMEVRGHSPAITAIRESVGYPVDIKATRNLTEAIPCILDDCQREINDLFPKIKPFQWNKKEGRFSVRQKVLKDWIKANCDEDMWQRTDSGDISLALEAWTRFFDFKHDYPKDNFGAQMVRYYKLKQNLTGFSASKKSRTFWDYVGPDERVRPYMNIYGAATSRSQPAATGFMFLKPAWMRTLVQPKPGKAIGSIDYGSEEFFISALVSGDQNMIDAYLSGDVYLAFAKLAGMVPENGTKEEYKKERNLCKATTLGLSYLMSKYGLANKLSQDTGETWSEEEAQGMIDLFHEAYPVFTQWQKDLIPNYESEGFMKLPCGWYEFGDNDNFRAISNFPIQGFGASIMRKADELCNRRGLSVIFTLHDALYIEFDSDDHKAMDILRECMTEAFAFYFEGENKELAKKIKLDPYMWSPDYQEDSEIITPKGWKIDCSNKYVDERAESEYNLFSKYFEDNAEKNL